MASRSKMKEGKKQRLPKTLTLDPKQRNKRKPQQVGEKRKKNHGPNLPSSLRKELEPLNPSSHNSDPDEEQLDEDLYEYEEPLPQEESRKNRRFDPVDNYEYELPEDFKDENIPSDDDEDDDLPSDQSDGDDRHQRMLKGITGLPGEAFADRKKLVFGGAQGADKNEAPISIQDLLDPLQGKPGFSKLRKRLQKLEQKPMGVQPPLPKVERERLERKVAYNQSKKDITKWEPLVKQNREAPTLFFEEDVDLGFSTVGAIASEFEPRTEFEKKMALLVGDPEVREAHWKDGSKILELNKVTVEDVKERQNRLAKMRSLLFRHEMKAKHIKKIKSKTYHRILKKSRSKATSTEIDVDNDAVKEHAKKLEFKRAEERMTLKHKNSSKWAKRILKRGLKVQDEGTLAAISEQLQEHALLTRKRNSMKDDSSSSDDSSDDEDDDQLSLVTNTEGVSKILHKAKDKTIKLTEDDHEIPKSGVFALPFMERGLKKRKEAADEEARLALQEYDSSLKQLEDGKDKECPTLRKGSGRKVFGAAIKESREFKKRSMSDGNISGSEDEFESQKHEDVVHEVNQLEDAKIVTTLHDESEMDQEAIYKSFNDIVKDPGPKTTYEVAIFASDSWKKMKAKNVVDGTHGTTKKSSKSKNPVLPNEDLKEMDQNSDSDTDEEMVDGILSSGAKLDYELPSQTDLIRLAFAGDDVEAEFEKDKMDILDEENPAPEEPTLVPGWGQWTHVQQKNGLPSWMLKEHENSKRKREETLKKRKDAHLQHVIISEKIDKKAGKLQVESLPYPYTSKEVYEQSIRMPIGPEYNPAGSFRALNRPAVVKKDGMVIKPIQYEEVDPYEKDEPKTIKQKSKQTKKTKKTNPVKPRK